MVTTRAAISVYVVCSVALIAHDAGGQDYPSRTIRIVTNESGGNGDLNARLIAPDLGAMLGQPVIVENRTGTIIPAQTAAKATPDGHTLLALGSSLWVGPLLQSVPYDPVRDFAPVTLSTSSPQVLLLHPSVTASSVKELIALAKAKPGALNYASGGAGGSPHLAAELFKAMAGVDIMRVPYKGGAASLTALVGGEVQMTFASAAAAMSLVKAGKVKAIAVTTAQPSILAPGLPTVAASGVPGYESATVIGIFAPAGTPAALIRTLNRLIVQVLNRAEVKERLLSAGMEAVGNSPEQFAAGIRGEMARMSKVIKSAGIRVE